MKRPTVRSRSRQVAAVAVLTGLLLVGFADARKSQPVAAAPADPPSTSTPPASKSTAEKPPRKKNKGKPKWIWIVFAKHAILVRETMTQNADLSAFRIVTWDELVQLLRDTSRKSRFIPALYPTVETIDQFNVRGPELLKIAEELKASSTYCGGMQYNSSMRYNAIRTPADLKPDLTRRREGLVRLANGQPAVGATAVLVTAGKYDCSIYIDNRDIRDPLDEIWIKTDEQGAITSFPPATSSRCVLSIRRDSAWRPPNKSPRGSRSRWLPGRRSNSKAIRRQACRPREPERGRMRCESISKPSATRGIPSPCRPVGFGSSG